MSGTYWGSLFIKEILSNVVHGINKNESVNQESLVIYGYALIQEAFGTLKLKEDIVDLNDSMVRNYEKAKKITKEDVMTVQACAA